MKALLALLLAIGLGVGLAAAFVPSNAATVGGVGISQSTLNSDLSTIANTRYGCFLTGSTSVTSGAGTAGAETTHHGTYSTSFVDEWLDNMIVGQLTADLAQREGLKVTPAVTSLARGALERQMTSQLQQETTCGASTGPSLLQSLPSSFATAQVAATANKVALAFHEEGIATSQSGLAGYYATHATSFNKVCVTLIEYRTSTAATKAATAIKAGTLTFATAVAAAKATATSQTEKAGTVCEDLNGTTPTQILAGTVGQLVGPVTATSTYILSEVKSSTTRSFSSARGAVVTAIYSAGETKVDVSLEAALKTTPVSVDPRYGTFSLRGVSAPQRLPAVSVLNPTLNDPSS